MWTPIRADTVIPPPIPHARHTHGSAASARGPRVPDMSSPSRHSNRPQGQAAVTGSEGEPAPVSARDPAGGGARGGGEASSGHHQRQASVDAGEERETAARCRTNAPNDGLEVFQSRSIFHFTRRQSSGYFSAENDSVPGSPLSPRPATADRATQTPTPSAQVITHALQSVAEARGAGAGTQRTNDQRSSSSTRQERGRGRAARDMQAERTGQKLQQIGDDYERFIQNRREWRRRHQAVIGENPLPPWPSVLLCVGLLLLGRIIFLHASISGRDPSQG